MIPKKRDISEACVLVNGLSSEQYNAYLMALKDSSAQELLNNPEMFEAFSNGYLIGLFARENMRHEPAPAASEEKK